jgi:hypothetical protein
MILSPKLRRLCVFLTMILIVVLFPIAVKAQPWSYTDETLDYVLELPSAKWRAVKVPSITHTGTEFRYGERSPIHLRIRRELVDANLSPADLIHRKQISDRVFLRGYVKGKSESFAGQLNGAKYPYQYIKTGKPMAGLIYYLEADNRITYRLEFTGPSDKLRNLSDQTELIARSFRLR